MAEPVCRIARLEKAFGANRVLRQLSLDLPAGQVTAMLGANGAGKSTLVKILSGVHAADGGEVRLAGAPFAPAGPADAIRELEEWLGEGPRAARVQRVEEIPAESDLPSRFQILR